MPNQTKPTSRRDFLEAALAASGVLMSSASFKVFAQANYPMHPLTLVVGFSAGGQSDILARRLAAALEPVLGQPVVVQNKVGGTSTIATRFVADAKPDGYTLLLGGGSGMVMAPLVMKVPYDPIKDFKSISQLTSAMMSISVHPSVPANTLQELVDLVKKNPGKYSYATSGFGGSDHMAGELFKQAAGDLDLLHVPYKGAAPASQDVIAGQVPILITTLSSIYPYSKTGQLRILAGTGATRSSAAPEIPTAVEAGVPGLIAETYNFVNVPAETPQEVVDVLSKAVAKLMADPEFVDSLRSLQYEPVTDSNPAKADAYIKSEIQKWQEVVRKAKIEAR